jgi:hypothetical protein
MVKSSKAAQAAWFKYKEAAKNTTRPAQSCVDFVAGFNAAIAVAMEIVEREQLALGKCAKKKPKKKPKKKKESPKFKVGDLVWWTPFKGSKDIVFGIVAQISPTSAYVVGASGGWGAKISELRLATELAIVRYYRKKFGHSTDLWRQKIDAAYQLFRIKKPERPNPLPNF